MSNAAPVDTAGAIDCDGHVLEQIDTLADYLENEYKGRAIGLEVGDDGLEYFTWDNKRSKLCFGGFAGVLGAVGDPTHYHTRTALMRKGVPQRLMIR